MGIVNPADLAQTHERECMNTLMKTWLDFGVKAVIVVVAVYLAMVLVFRADYRKTDAMLSTLKGQVASMEKQNQFLTAMSMNNNTDALYHMALEDEARGDVASAVKKLSMALQLSEYNTQQYKIKLSQLAGR